MEPGTLPNMCTHLLAKMDSRAKSFVDGYQDYSGLVTHPRNLCACVVKEVSLTPGLIDMVILTFFFHSSRTQLLLLTFFLKCQREVRPNLLSLTSPSCSQPRGPSITYLIFEVLHSQHSPGIFKITTIKINNSRYLLII